MKKEEALRVFINCDVQNFYVHHGNILSVDCKILTWRELRLIAKEIIDITEHNGNLHVSIELD